MSTSSHLEVNLKPGYTPLHHIVRNCTQADEIFEFIKEVDSKIVNKMALTVNNEGELPITLLEKRSFVGEGNKEIQALLASVMLDCPVKPLSELINFNDICEQYQIQADDPRYKYLEMDCFFANEVRQKITQSTTHPQYNQLTADERRQLREKHLAIKEQRIEKKILEKGNVGDSYGAIKTNDPNRYAIAYILSDATCNQIVDNKISLH